MNRETRDKFASGTDQGDLTTGNAVWETAPAVFEKLSEDFGPFQVDICADTSRHLCATWFGPDSNVGEFDALKANWRRYGLIGYCNPPYGAFVQKILPLAKAQAAEGFASTFLLPMRVTAAFKAHVLRGASDLLFCDKRLVFWENGAPRLNPKTGKPDSAMFDSIIVRYAAGVWDRPRLGEWRVPEHATVARITPRSLLDGCGLREDPVDRIA